MKIAIIGYGRMGKTIERLALVEGHEVVLKIGRDNTFDFTETNMQRADVAIEFSLPDTAFDNIRRCIEWGIPVVSGTTGWLDKKLKIEDLCKKKNGTFLYASNFSIGVNVFFAVNKKLAAMMNQHIDYEMDVEEIHHTKKLDAPSGTAITIAEDIIAQIDRKTKWVHPPADHPNHLNIAAQRIESVPGTHTVRYKCRIDTIEIKHTAHSREGFAKGAILAAKWIVGKTGVFDMTDVLGI